MATPELVEVWVGLDMGKDEHFAEVLDDDGERLFARSVIDDQAALEALLDRGDQHGNPGLVIDPPGSIAQLVLAVARARLREWLSSIVPIASAISGTMATGGSKMTWSAAV